MTYSPIARNACPDCGVGINEMHEPGCDVARCMNCGGQALSCGCDWADTATWADSWSGYWPGDLEAAKMGLWSFWGPDYGLTGWVSCGPDHPDAGPDLNTYYQITVWDKKLKKRVLRSKI